MTPAFVIGAPQTGSGKTLVTLGLLRAYRRRGLSVAPAKVGPDYIDPAFHAAASGRACVNLDGWAMRPATLDGLVGGLTGDLAVIEGVMGLFDGAPTPGAAGDGSTAAIARRYGLPVVLVVDSRGLAGSAAALLYGFRHLDLSVRVAGVIFNQTGSARQVALLRAAAARVDLPVIGMIPALDRLRMPSRHLGLVQASEQGDLEALIDAAADHVAGHVDLDALAALATPPQAAGGDAVAAIPPFGRRIAVASDDAFRFAYPHLLEGWRRAGAAILPFSPLADEPVPDAADAVWLPGGYPELHGARLAAAGRFLGSVRRAASGGLPVWGECGGYMVLGRAIVDAEGARHEMAGLLPAVTSFAQRERHLGYRRGRLRVTAPLGVAGATFVGHEFHYATLVEGAGEGEALLDLEDATGRPLGPAGHREGSVAGSFLHPIDRAA